MGRSDLMLNSFYRENIKPKGDVALLGFVDNVHLAGDLYDIALKNWDINSDWQLQKKYDTIVCTRCAYFAKNPEDFIKRCYDNLKEGGILYVDWALGDHWRFDNYKIGWVKDGEQEHAYNSNNYLWSAVWDDEFLDHPQFQLFSERVKKFGYNSVEAALFEEVPSLLRLQTIKEFFKTSYEIITLWEDMPQVYILISGIRK